MTYFLNSSINKSIHRKKYNGKRLKFKLKYQDTIGKLIIMGDANRSIKSYILKTIYEGHNIYGVEKYDQYEITDYVDINNIYKRFIKGFIL